MSLVVKKLQDRAVERRRILNECKVNRPGFCSGQREGVTTSERERIKKLDAATAPGATNSSRRTVERLMRMQGLQGVRRGKRLRTTIADDAGSRPLDRVNRQFRADRPN